MCAARPERNPDSAHGHNLASFLFAIIGTGISSTLVIGGRLWAGHRGEAIALGELSVDPALALRPGAPLTVEEQASGRAMSEAVAGGGSGRVRGQGGQVRAARVEAVEAGGGCDSRRETARRGTEVEVRAGEIVAGALNNAVQLLDPAAVIVGGGLGSSDGDFFGSLSRHYLELTRGRPEPPPLLQSQFGARAGVIGAGLLALEGSPADLLGL